MSSENHRLLSFGEFIVDCENFRVLSAGEIITLTPKAFDLLIYLIRHSERVVEKKELFDQVWPDTIVTDNALTKVVKELRHVLKDDVNAPKYIETVPKRGYRFIAQVTASDLAAGLVTKDLLLQATSLPFALSSRFVGLSITGLVLVLILSTWLISRKRDPEVAPSTIRSIAVLPFKPLSAESRDESLEVGMAETLITRLSSLRQVVVRPLSSVRKFANLEHDSVKTGQAVQADAVLEGTIQKSGERIRVTARLVDVRRGETLWSQQFDENFTDIFKVQDSIAKRITDALAIKLSSDEQEQLAKHHTDSPEAYQLYLQGHLIWQTRRPNWFEESLVYYRKALEKDPNFGLAYVGIADSYITQSGDRRISMREAEINARPAIIKALELDNQLAMAHNALAELKYQYEYDWATSENEFKTAIKLNPNVAWIHQAYGWFLMSEGRFDEAGVEMDKAGELDPSSIRINAARGRLFYYSRQYDKALQHFQNILSVEPDIHSFHFFIYAIYAQQQMYPEAVEAYLTLLGRNGVPAGRLERIRADFKVSGWEGFLRKRLEETKEEAKTEKAKSFRLVPLYAQLGDKEQTLALLDEAVKKHEPFVLQLKVEPLFDILRDDPRYAQLLRRIGLQP